MALPIPEKALDQHIIALGKTGAGKSSALRVLVEHILDQEKPVCIIDPKGDWWGLKSSANGTKRGYPVVIFGGAHADVPVTPQAGAALAELVATGNRPCIIDLKSWTIGERTRFFIDFASTLFRVTKGKRFLVIDECHNVAPQGKVWDADSGKMIHWANRLGSEGRGLGLTLLSASQRPQKVHKDYLTCHETLIGMRVTHPLDRGAVKDWMDGAGDVARVKEILPTLAEMKRGEAWAWSPEIGFGPKRVTFPMFKTYDSFKPAEVDAPDQLAGWATVDLGEVSERMQQIIETARASDPASLRKRIADLEQENAKLLSTKHVHLDPGALKARWDDGYSQGQLKILAKLSGLIASIDAAQQHIGAGKESLDRAYHDALKLRDGPIDGSNTIDPNVTVAFGLLKDAPKGRPVTLSTRIPSNGEASQLSKAERAILGALDTYGICSKKKLALLTGYASTGGGFNNALGALRVKGAIDGKDPIQVTPHGSITYGPFERLPRGQALYEHWMGQLGKAEAACFQVIYRSYPEAISKDNLAYETDYAPSGGGFNNALGRLRTLQLIEGSAELRASEELFA